ncbi:MAG: OmpH family outer membrane protein [Bacteroidales bacterium]|nr:OmpH family outer membrane protein [Bacteroidales bacterium]MDZ4058792.1 OmpH family outer membrane protein [Bacteroidales bacterium]
MKKLFLILVLLTAFMASATAQATGYVNTETILSNIPEYIQAQQQLERLKSQYEVQIEREVATIENLFKKYQSEKSMLNDLQRQSRENEIITKERAVKERQAEIFGQDGLMSTRSKQLLDPIKNIVQGAIDIVAKESGVVIVFDLASVQGVIFTDPRGDLTPRVLNKLGIK